MARLKIRTREQQILAVPFVAGILAGLGALIYLFLIPADPNNSIILGFSLARLIEALGILAATLILCFTTWLILSEPDRAIRIYELLGWRQVTSWSLAVSWAGLLTGLFVLQFMNQIFPGQVQIFERLLPAVIFAVLVCAFFTAVNLGFVFRTNWGNKFKFLIIVSLIVMAAGLLAGLALFPARVGLSLRQGSLLVLLLISPALAFSFTRRDFRGDMTTLIILAAIFGGAIIGVWASGTSDLNIIAGLLPYNDANGYYHGARLLSEGQTFHPFSAKRPVFPALLGVLFTIGGQNLQFAIGCLVLISLLAVFFAAREVNHTSGAICTAFFVFALFLFIRRFIGSVMSETLGLPLGVIGFGLLWSGANRKRLMDIYAGIFVLCIGLIARAGPFFMLPFLILWAGWLFRGETKFNWKVAGFAALAAVLGFGVHLTIFKILAGVNSSSMGNFSYTFYGLVVGGKGWKQYMVDHPEVMALVEPAQSQAIYRYAFDALKADPMGIVRGALAYWRAFFTFDWSGMFGYIEGTSPMESLICRIVMAILTLTGLVAAIREFRRPAFSMLLAGWVGIFLSIPFVPTVDAEIRTYAAAIPWFAGLAMIGLWSLLVQTQLLKITPHGDTPLAGVPYGLGAYAAVVILLTFVGPLLVHALIKPVAVPATSQCPVGSTRLVTTIARGAYINVVDDASRRQSMIPTLRYTDFDLSIKDSPIYSLAVKIFPVKSGDSFFYGYDYIEKRLVYILGRTALFDSNSGFVELCGWQETGNDKYGFFHAESANPIGR
jgi:hypothetical protein